MDKTGLILGVPLVGGYLYLRIRSTRRGTPLPWLHILFFFSGFPALIYEIVWQRALFAAYGVNIESVTVVVSAFMLGLGLGSLVGGHISLDSARPLLMFFAAAELGTATFGIFSLRIFHAVAVYTAGAVLWKTALLSFALVVLPTVLMGATLPLLVAHMVRMTRQVGYSVSGLYFVNTLGSAYACFVAGGVLMREFGMSGSVRIAAAINATVGILVLLCARYAPQPVAAEAAAAAVTGNDPAQRQRFIPFWLATLGVGLSGFIALAYEIVWYRLLSFASGGKAKVFAYLLGTYLAGIAFGALGSERLCRSTTRDVKKNLQFVAAFVVLANIVGFLVAPIGAAIARYAPIILILPVIFVAAGLLGATFPLLSDLSLRPDAAAGAGLSRLYMSNIVGSALGSFLVGFVLMDHLSIRQISVLLVVLGMGLALLLSGVREARVPMRGALGAAACITLAAMVLTPVLYHHLYERLLEKKKYQPDMQFAHEVENRSGVVTVTSSGVVYGGGMYDGWFSTDLVVDHNLIVRGFALSSLHAAPKQVLMIGLSSGSWAQVIVNNPYVEHLDIVEINPGYLGLISQYPMVSSLLTNPRATIFIDDGRRWLLSHPDRKYDAIVMNTTFNWREFTTNLLSAEFFEILRKHMNPGAIFLYNTTGEPRAYATGLTVFPYGLRVLNFLAVSDVPIKVDKERWRSVLLEYKLDGKPVLDMDRPEAVKCLEKLMALADSANTGDLSTPYVMEYGERLRKELGPRRIITDDNMGGEWWTGTL